MRIGIIGMAITLGFAAIAKDASDFYRIQTTLKYKVPLQEEFSSTREVLVPKRSQQWVPLTEPKEHIVLLGRVVQSVGNSVKVEYMLVDGNRSSGSIVATPSLVARLEEEASLSVSETGQAKYSISMLAKESAGSTQQLSPDQN